MGFFSGIKKVFKKVAKVALPAIGIASGIGAFGAIAGIGAAGAAAGSAAAGLTGASAAAAALSGGAAGVTFGSAATGIAGAFSGITSAIRGFGGSTLGQGLKIGGTLLNAFGSYQQASAQADVFGINAGIAATNAAELQALFELQTEALDTQIKSTKEAADIREREIANKRARAIRSEGFGRQAIARDQSILGLSKTGVTQRRDINQQIIAATISNIDAQSAEEQRQLDLQRSELVGQARSTAAAAGLRVDSDSVTESVNLINRETNFAKSLAKITADVERGNVQRRGDIDISEASQRLDEINLRFGEIDQRSAELSASLEDALFDAALELEISQRNESIAIERAEFEKKILKKRKDTSVAVSQAQQQAFNQQQSAAKQAAFINPITIVSGLA